jgi:hypothetical protein
MYQNKYILKMTYIGLKLLTSFFLYNYIMATLSTVFLLILIYIYNVNQFFINISVFEL